MGKFATVQITLVCLHYATNKIADVKTQEGKVLPITLQF
jgi:hypothetical protein